MNIKFVTAYEADTHKILAQADLLTLWQKSIENSQIKFIKKADIEFLDYAIYDYQDQDKVRKALADGTGYEGEQLEEAYKTLLKQTRVMELVITPEDYD